MKKVLPVLLLTILAHVAGAQQITKSVERDLQKREDSLKGLAAEIVMGKDAAVRVKADSMFTRQFVRALVSNNSFYYPFDSLYSISRLYAPDSSFRIYTWQLVINDNMTRQHGAIQMRTADGSLKLIPLIDKSDITLSIADTTGNNKGWMGAVYYSIIQKKVGTATFYTLLGYDENNIRSNRKIIEVLRFFNDEPIFGGRYFSFENDAKFKSNISRFVMEYKKEAGPRLSWDAELDMIVVEHLVSESGQPDKKWTLIGDGDYEGFRWFNGKWVHQEKLFSLVTPDGKPPMPKTMYDDKGNVIPKKDDEDKPKKNDD